MKPGHEVKGLYETAEVLIPRKFSSNTQKQAHSKRFPIGYLQHSTHAQEMDNIWDGETSTFKGKSKLAMELHFYADHCNIMSWKEGGDYRPVLRATTQ